MESNVTIFRGARCVPMTSIHKNHEKNSQFLQQKNNWNHMNFLGGTSSEGICKLTPWHGPRQPNDVRQFSILWEINHKSTIYVWLSQDSRGNEQAACVLMTKMRFHSQAPDVINSNHWKFHQNSHERVFVWPTNRHRKKPLTTLSGSKYYFE